MFFKKYKYFHIHDGLRKKQARYGCGLGAQQFHRWDLFRGIRGGRDLNYQGVNFGLEFFHLS